MSKYVLVKKDRTMYYVDGTEFYDKEQACLSPLRGILYDGEKYGGGISAKYIIEHLKEIIDAVQFYKDNMKD